MTSHKSATKVHPILVGRFAANLKRERARRGWSTRELAGKIGITPAYVSLLENCERHPTLEMVEQCAKAFERDPMAMLKKETT